jgi:hypothetical protein
MDGSQIAVIVAIVVVILLATGVWGRRRGRD